MSLIFIYEGFSILVLLLDKLFLIVYLDLSIKLSVSGLFFCGRDYCFWCLWFLCFVNYLSIIFFWYMRCVRFLNNIFSWYPFFVNFFDISDQWLLGIIQIPTFFFNLFNWCIWFLRKWANDIGWHSFSARFSPPC